MGSLRYTRIIRWPITQHPTTQYKLVHDTPNNTANTLIYSWLRILYYFTTHTKTQEFWYNWDQTIGFEYEENCIHTPLQLLNISTVALNNFFRACDLPWKSKTTYVQIFFIITAAYMWAAKRLGKGHGIITPTVKIWFWHTSPSNDHTMCLYTLAMFQNYHAYASWNHFAKPKQMSLTTYLVQHCHKDHHWMTTP